VDDDQSTLCSDLDFSEGSDFDFEEVLVDSDFTIRERMVVQ
jgi:hypothetical protein